MVGAGSVSQRKSLPAQSAPRLRGGAIADTFIAKGLRVERRHDRWNGISYMAWRPHVSMLFTDTKEMLAFVGWPRKTPTGDALREWLTGSSAAPPEAPAADASGFGPDPDDPNANTRTII